MWANAKTTKRLVNNIFGQTHFAGWSCLPNVCLSTCERWNESIYDLWLACWVYYPPSECDTGQRIYIFEGWKKSTLMNSVKGERGKQIHYYGNFGFTGERLPQLELRRMARWLFLRVDESISYLKIPNNTTKYSCPLYHGTKYYFLFFNFKFLFVFVWFAPSLMTMSLFIIIVRKLRRK